jgi:hypothetical protein
MLSAAPAAGRTPEARFGPGQAWALGVVCVAVLVAYGGVWTRGIQGDDLCMCELASVHGYRDAVRLWLKNWNGRLFLALTQIGSYQLPWFSSPLRAPWFILHAVVVLAHLASCALLLRLLARAGVSSGAALAPVLVFAIHPAGFEPVLWLAAAYGYVFGALLTLSAAWAYLAYERSRRVAWLALACMLALAAALGIEQYLAVLGALAVLQLLRSWRRGGRGVDWLPVLIVAACALVFVAIHFGIFSSTGSRLARATASTGATTAPSLAWQLAWSMSVVPHASPYGGVWTAGLESLGQHGALRILVAVAALVAAWRIAVAGAWADGTRAPSTERLWLFGAGLVIFLAAMAPFLFTGTYGFGRRNLYAALPGLVVAGSAALDLLARPPALRLALRCVLALVAAAFVTISLVTNIGAQSVLARAWSFHLELIAAVEAESDAIRKAGAVQLSGIPSNPYKAIAQIDNAWAFPCLVRWVVSDGEVKAWNNLMRAEDRQSASQGAHRIDWRERQR